MLQDTPDGATAARPVATPSRSEAPDAKSKDDEGNQAVGDKPQDEKKEQDEDSHDEKPREPDVKNTAPRTKTRQEPFPSFIDFHPACMVLGSANCRDDSLSLSL